MNTLIQKLYTFAHAAAISGTSWSLSEPCLVLNRIQSENITG